MAANEQPGPVPGTVSPEGFFEEAPVLTTVAGFDGFFKELGGPWTRVTGWSHAELAARPFFDFVHPDDVAATEAELARLGEGHETAAFVNRYRRADGGWVWLQWHARVVDAERIYAIALDVSAAVAQERALARQRELLRIVADLQRDELSGLDSVGSITGALTAALPLIGAHSGTAARVDTGVDGQRTTVCLASTDAAAPCQPGTRTTLLADVQIDTSATDARATALEVASLVVADGHACTVRALDPDPHAAPQHLLGLPLGAPNPVGVLGIVAADPFPTDAADFLRPLTGAIATIIERDRDRADRRAMSSQVLRLSSVLATMLDRSEFILIATDRHERVAFLSAAAVRWLGSDAPAEGRWAFDRLRAPGATTGPTLAEAFPVDAGGVREVEWGLLDAHGDPVPMVVSGSTIADPLGRTEGWVLLCTPLADRQQAEQARIEHASLAAQVELLRDRERQLAALTEAT
ncbi:MAG: PAS domain S-box protein [Actinomycetes bacterium]